MFESIRKLFSRSTRGERDLYPIYVRCAGCGEPHTTRVHLFRDLSLEFSESGEPSGYICRKTLVSGRDCYDRIRVTLKFDKSRKLVEQQVEGGEFLTAEAFEALNQDSTS